MSGNDILMILSAFLASYTYIFYPLVLFVIAKIFPRPAERNDRFCPEITIVISAYNEEEFIGNTISSIKNSDYPKEKIQIYIGSDGSGDRTNEIVKNLSSKDPRIHLFELNRMGKNQVLNNLIPKVETDFVVLMDADVSLKSDALLRLMTYMIDENTGCTIASLDTQKEFHSDNAGSKGGTLYHKYEENLRVLEAEAASNVNAMGALYCIRKELFTTIPNDSVCDDLYIVYSIINNRKRVLFARDSRCTEIRSRSLKHEYNRRIRLVAGGLSTIKEFSNLLNIFKYGINSFFIWSHKVFRWISPLFFLILLLATITADYDSSVFKVSFIAQVILYGNAFIGWLFEKLGVKIRFFQIFVFFVSMNNSTISGLLRFVKKQQNSLWNNLGFDE
ncbi:MAG: glycosyltransferase [Candidatus Kapaibacterium sp.]|nr:glycosyltransferase [Candidatus Kapabacteria bacterium]